MTLHPTERADPVVRLERLVPATPDAVFAAWTDPALIARWMSPLGHAEATVDVRVGGALQIAMVDGGIRIEHSGEFLEVARPHRLRFTWTSPYTGPKPSIVTVTFEPVSGQTRLILVHERLPAAAVESHAGGWGSMVDRLIEVLTAGSTQEEVAQ